MLQTTPLCFSTAHIWCVQHGDICKQKKECFSSFCHWTIKRVVSTMAVKSYQGMGCLANKHRGEFATSMTTSLYHTISNWCDIILTSHMHITSPFTITCTSASASISSSSCRMSSLTTSQREENENQNMMKCTQVPGRTLCGWPACVVCQRVW